MKDWFGILLVVLSVFAGGFAIGFAWVDERTYEMYVQKYQGLEVLMDKRRKKHE